MAQIIGETNWGIVEFDTNEITIKSKLEDPPKIRMAAGEGVSSGAVSFNRLINGAQRENVLFQGKQDERVRNDPHNPAGEFTLHLSDGSSFEDDAMVRVMEFRHDTLELLGSKFTKEQIAELLKLVERITS